MPFAVRVPVAVAVPAVVLAVAVDAVPSVLGRVGACDAVGSGAGGFGVLRPVHGMERSPCLPCRATVPDVLVFPGTVRAVRWQRQDVPGALAAWAAAVSALLVIVNPSPMLRAALAVLAPMVVLLAFLTSLQQGSCPSCRAPRRRQERLLGDPTVVPSSRAVSSSEEVGVDTGWDVDLPVQFSCGRCGNARRVVTTRFVPRSRASTPSEAVLIAQREPL